MKSGSVGFLLLIISISIIVLAALAYKHGLIKLESDRNKLQENSSVLSSPTPLSSNLGNTIPPDEVLVYGNLPGFDKEVSAGVDFTSPTFKIGEGGYTVWN